MSKPKVVLIGGGTGSFTLLGQLKKWTPNITAIVNMSDDGGSSGILRDELGVLPPGDIRQCLVALSNHPETRELFSYRFANGKLASHAVGNIILSALELQTGSFTKAIQIVSDFMQITGKVVPVTEDKHVLLLQDGKETIEGEFIIIKHHVKNRDAKISLKPDALLNKEAANAIRNADMIVIAPGNLYGSILPTLCVKGMAAALKKTDAVIVMVANLVNKPAQTLNWHVVDYVHEIENYIGKSTIDYVLYNNKLPSKQLLLKYAEDKEFPVGITKPRFSEVKTKVIGAPLVARKIHSHDPADKLIRRTLIRHDAPEVSRQLTKLVSLK
ncbi:MAG: gluconeogenesis factor YvcK family protein [Candidatus Saccharimonadales bacterium]